MFGFYNINKPRDLTSRDVVNRLCMLTNSRQVGHAGTLDPLATGVLVVCVGPATRLVNRFQSMPKTYVGDFRLGVESSTEDRLGVLTQIPNPPQVSRTQMETVLSDFVGPISQMPPIHSALKINGKRAYELARKGRDVSLKSRVIEIHSLELLEFDYPDFRIKIRCGSGTYVRSLGRDIAKCLNSGAIMTELARTAIGGFSINDSVSLDALDADSFKYHLQPPLDAVRDQPLVMVDDSIIKSFLDGMFLRAETIRKSTELDDNCQEIVAVDGRNRLVAILERFDQNNFKPKTNFAHYWQRQSDVGKTGL